MANNLSFNLTRTNAHNCFGFSVSRENPAQITYVYMSTPADGQLQPGDHIISINGVPVDEIEDIPGMIGQNLEDRIKTRKWGTSSTNIPQQLNLSIYR